MILDCAACGYSLHGHAYDSHCPECGLPVELSVHRSPWRLRRWIFLSLAFLLTTSFACTFLIPRALGTTICSRRGLGKNQALTLAQTVRIWMNDNAITKLPSDFSILTLRADPDPYLQFDHDIVDPWGAAFQVVSDPDSSAFQIVSFGADGKAGGDGEDADIMAP
jgi:hypothetical protein